MKINGKEYSIPDLNDFETVCRLEEQGINLVGLMSNAGEKFNAAPFCTIREALAGFMGVSKDEASAEIKEHVKNGGTISELMEIITNEINELVVSGTKSGFSKAEKTPQDHNQKTTAQK